MRVLLGAFGDPGHAFPVIALGAELVERGHEVGIETWTRWREPAEAAGMAFSPAPEYQVFPTRERPLKPYEAAVLAAKVTRQFVRAFEPEVVVSDILTTAPALAGELEGLPVATLIPHVHPDVPTGLPPFSIGARRPRTRLGAVLWRQTDRMVAVGLEQGRGEYNDCRARLGLPPLPYTHTGLSRSLTMVGTFPQLEYPRAWPPWVRIVGPMLWEPGGPQERVRGILRGRGSDQHDGPLARRRVDGRTAGLPHQRPDDAQPRRPLARVLELRQRGDHRQRAREPGVRVRQRREP